MRLRLLAGGLLTDCLRILPIQGSGLGLDSFANRPDCLQSPDYASPCGTHATESGNYSFQGSIRIVDASHRDHFCLSLFG